MRIFILEDDNYMVDGLTTALSDLCGNETIVCKTVEDAFKTLESKPDGYFDAFVIDLMMRFNSKSQIPELMNISLEEKKQPGEIFYTRLRNRSKYIDKPVVIHTCLSKEDVEERFQRDSKCHSITKGTLSELKTIHSIIQELQDLN